MSRPVFYMAHPVSENMDGLRGPQYYAMNVRNARRWLAWLQENDRTRVYMAPWISEVEAFIKGHIKTTYDQALADDEEIVSRCDGIILVGGRVTLGMARELDRMNSCEGQVINLAALRSPPRGAMALAIVSLLNIKVTNE